MRADDSKVGRFLQYYAGQLLLEPDPDQPAKDSLTQTERDNLQKYERVYELMNVGRPDYMIRAMLCKIYGIKDRQAHEIIKDASMLYSLSGEASREGSKRSSINFYETVATLALADRNYDAAVKARDKADHLAGHHKQEDIGLNPDDFRKPAKYVFINNMTVYEKAQKELDPDD